jgi:soluble lytic murein transglycosylase
MSDGDEAALHYQNAATQPVAYYGQLAAERLGLKRLALRSPQRIAEGAKRNDAVRAADALYDEGLDDLAVALAYEAARSWRDEAQMAAMADVVQRRGDAATQVQFGKIAMLRGYAFDAMAFPGRAPRGSCRSCRRPPPRPRAGREWPTTTRGSSSIRPSTPSLAPPSWDR